MEKQGIDRRTLIKRAGIAGAVAWTAPVIIGSLASPAAAITATFTGGCTKINVTNTGGACDINFNGGCNDPTCPCPGQATNWQQVPAGSTCFSAPAAASGCSTAPVTFTINPGCTSCRFVQAQWRDGGGNCGTSGISAIGSNTRTVTFTGAHTQYEFWITCGC